MELLNGWKRIKFIQKLLILSRHNSDPEEPAIRSHCLGPLACLLSSRSLPECPRLPELHRDFTCVTPHPPLMKISLHLRILNDSCVLGNRTDGTVHLSDTPIVAPPQRQCPLSLLRWSDNCPVQRGDKGGKAPTMDRLQ